MDQNPIDKDKVTETPHSLEYGHHRGSAVIRPEDKGKISGRAVNAMEHQTDMQLEQIRQQMELLAKQARAIQDRKDISLMIYQAEMRFEPLINHTYHLYRREDDRHLLSMIAPDDWGRNGCPFSFRATVKLLADHTWEVIQSAED
jgi:hypothetical protein